MIGTIRRVLFAILAFVLLAVPAFAQPSAQNEFVPVSQLPQAEQVPAAPLVIAAYAFVWLAVMVYLWSIWRRVTKVEADVQALRRRTAGETRR